MPRDAQATRAKILDAAVEEFAAHGLGGGRIERIAELSGANPRSIYRYFTSKEELFHAAVYKVLHAVGEAAPMTEHDLPNWAGRAFDEIVAHPEAVRLHYWRSLEAPDAGPDDRELYASKIVALMSDDRESEGELPPADLLVLVSHMTTAWSSMSRDLLTADGSDPTAVERRTAHRAALVEAVRRICPPAALTDAGDKTPEER